MRTLTDHKVNGLNEAIDINVQDEPGAGGADHHYQIVVHHDNTPATVHEVLFQHGPIAELGINGISNEALLAIVIDRMRGFQSGKFVCRENAARLAVLGREIADQVVETMGDAMKGWLEA